MYSKIELTKKYLQYYLTASNGKGHGIHSPFVFSFIKDVLNDKRNFQAYAQVEALRSCLLTDTSQLTIEDFGAGSATGATKQRTVADIAKHAAKSRKFGQLLFRIANYYHPSIILELGTSLGLSAAYLAFGNTSARVVTCEGAAAIAAVAKENFRSLELPGIELIKGNFDKTLQPLLDKIENIDLAFIDGNHRQEPTLRYFEQILKKINRNAVLVFDDIHWSRDMEAAWQKVKEHPRAMLTVDLFFMGLVFFRDEFKVKQHFSIRF